MSRESKRESDKQVVNLLLSGNGGWLESNVIGQGQKDSPLLLGAARPVERQPTPLSHGSGTPSWHCPPPTFLLLGQPSRRVLPRSLIAWPGVRHDREKDGRTESSPCP